MCVIPPGPLPTWGTFAASAPELAAFVAERLWAEPSYLATVRTSGAPRVHPVTPIVTDDGLYVFDRYVVFELRPTEVSCNGYGDARLPEPRCWRSEQRRTAAPQTATRSH